MKRKMTIGLVITALLTTLLWAGSLNPPAPPTSGTMKPLDDVEPRTAIHQSDIPLTISTSGSYYLAQNVTYTGGSGCITVSADNVTIDLSGYTMAGTGAAYHGIYMNGRNNVEIRNGTIRNFNGGITEGGTSGQNHRIFGVRILACESGGIYLLSCNNSQIRDCTISDCCTVTGASGSTYGIFVGDNCIVSGNTVYNNGTSSSCRPYGISTGSSCKVIGNTVYGNGISSTSDYATGIYTGFGCTITGNTAYGNGDLTSSAMVRGIYAGSGSVVTENTSYRNGNTAGSAVYGIYCSAGCTLTNNTAYENGVSSTNTVYGIYVSTGGMITGNSAYDNGDFSSGNIFGIYGGTGCTISGNSAYSNGTTAAGTYVYGIYASSGGTVVGNTARSNGSSASGTVYGIFLGGYNLVNNNTAYLNAGTSGGTNINTVASCTYGTNCAP